MREEQVGTTNDSLLMVEGCKNSNIVTVLIRAGNEMMVQEAKRSLWDAICVTRNLIKDNKIVYGGGSAELSCSIAVEQFAGSLGGMEQFVANGWAGKDFTHINYAGGRRVAWSLFDALNAGANRAYTEAEAARIRRQAEQAVLDSLRRRRIERDLIPGIPPETLNAPLK